MLQVWDLVDNVTMDGEKTGKNAARFVSGDPRKRPSEFQVMAGEYIRSVTPHRIVGKGPVEFAIRVQNSMEKAEFRIGAHTKK